MAVSEQMVDKIIFSQSTEHVQLVKSSMLQASFLTLKLYGMFTLTPGDVRRGSQSHVHGWQQTSVVVMDIATAASVGMLPTCFVTVSRMMKQSTKSYIPVLPVRENVYHVLNFCDRISVSILSNLYGNINAVLGIMESCSYRVVVSVKLQSQEHCKFMYGKVSQEWRRSNYRYPNFQLYTVSQKNVPPLVRYNFDISERILIFLAQMLPMQ